MIPKPTWADIAAGDFRAHPRYRGCVAHWMMLAGGGTRLFDISGFQNHGILTNMDPGSDWVVGQHGPAVDFDGINDFVNVGSKAAIDNVVPVTFTARIFPRGWGGGGFGRILDKSADYLFFVDNVNVTESLSVHIEYNGEPDATRARAVNNSLALNKWWFVGFFFIPGDGGVRLWINNGEPAYALRVADSGVKNDDSAAVARIGDNGAGTRGFNGIIDDVRWYKRFLAREELLSIYHEPFLEFRHRQRLLIDVPAAVGGNEGAAMYHHLQNLGVYS